MSSYMRQQLETYLNKLDVHCKSSLDIGGSSWPVWKRVKSWKVDEYRILDNCSEYELEKKSGKWQTPDYIGNLNKYYKGWQDYQKIKDKKFDVIFCLEVFEYLYDPVQAMKNIKRFLAKNGMLIVSFPFIYPVHEPIAYDSLRYTENGIRHILSTAGFSDWRFIYRKAKSPQMLTDVFSQESMHAAKGFGNHDVIGFICEAK